MPCRGPSDPSLIINPNKILIAPQIINEKHTRTTLAQSMPDSDIFIQCCAQCGQVKKFKRNMWTNKWMKHPIFTYYRQCVPLLVL